MTKRHFIPLLVLFSILAGGGWVALQSSLPSDSTDSQIASPRLLTVSTAPLVQQDSYTLRRRFTGQVYAARTSDLSFQLAGQIDSLFFDEGESVKEGDVLAKLDTRRLQANRKRLAAERLRAQAVLEELQNGSREEEIRVVRAEVEQLQSESVLYRNRFERTTKLVERGTMTRDELDLARSNWESISARLSAAEARRDEVVSGPRKEQIEAQQAMVSALEASIAELDVQLADSVLKAPYTGTLSSRLVDQGAVVPVSQPVFRLVEDRSLEFHVGLPISAVSALDQESTLEVLVDGQSYPARVTRKLPVLNSATRTQTVICQLDTSVGIVPGQTGELLLEEQIDQSGFWVPNTALQEGIQGLWTSYVAVPVVAETSSHTVEPRDVEVLHVEEDRSYIRGTLSTGEQLITSGLHRLVVDQSVRVEVQ